MSRFDDALTAIEQSLADLKDAIAHARSAKASQAEEAAVAPSDAAVDEAELRAMKAELGEAVRLLEAMQQTAPNQTSGQTVNQTSPQADEAVS